MDDVLELETVTCLVCGSGRSKKLMVGRDLRHDFPGEFPYVECEDCGLVYANPRVPPTRIALFYPRDYAPFSRLRAEVKVFSEREKEQLFKRLRREALLSRCGGRIGSRTFNRPFFDKTLAMLFAQTRTCRKSPLHFGGDGLRVLDVGCGVGGFLTQLRSLGWNVEGLEPEPKAAEVCREFGLKVKCATIEAADLAADWYDTITMWQTLEHLGNPLRALQTIQCALVPGGVLVGNTPNAAGLNRRSQKEYWWGYDPPRHYTVFSPKTLSKAMSLAGLRMRWHYCLSSERALTTALIYRAKAEGRLTETAAAPKPLVPSFIIAAWLRLVDRLSLGDNLWFVGQKPFDRV